MGKHCMATHYRKSGYSLIEMSVVLAILGILVGGIFASRSLIHSYELRSVITQEEKIYTAILNFRTKYKFLPGDMPNATDVWGIAGGTTGNDAACRTAAASYDKKTCNGNGNGQIEVNAGATGGTENLRIWQHLTNAEMIEGGYTGRYVGGSTRDTTNSPSGKILNMIWTTMWVGSQSGSTQYFDGEYDNPLWISMGPDDVSNPPIPVINNQDMYYIDNKTDDGKPAAGTVIAYAPTGTSLSDCATDSIAVNSSSVNAQYDLGNAIPICIIGWRALF